jgi:transmembrane sensor
MDDYSSAGKEGNVLPFGFRKIPVDEQIREDNWKLVEAGIRQGTEIVPVRRIRPLRVMMVLAPILLLAFGIWYMIYCTGNPGMEELKTGYGEVKNILLPDSSKIILNANSSIRMVQRNPKDGVSEVWLEGEAYFQVRKRSSAGKKFVVHTRQLDVEVLGTKFNVNTRREHAIVALEEGKVQLSVNGTTQTAPGKSEMVLRPGQVADVDGSRKLQLGSDKDVHVRSGWSRNEFHFDYTPLAEVARLIEDTYGYSMEAKDTTVFQMGVSGDLRASNLQELVKVLEAALPLSMRIENKKIYVIRP